MEMDLFMNEQNLFLVFFVVEISPGAPNIFRCPLQSILLVLQDLYLIDTANNFLNKGDSLFLSTTYQESSKEKL